MSKKARMEIIEEPMIENVTTRAKRSLLSAIVRTVWTVIVAWDWKFALVSPDRSEMVRKKLTAMEETLLCACCIAKLAEAVFSLISFDDPFRLLECCQGVKLTFRSIRFLIRRSNRSTSTRHQTSNSRTTTNSQTRPSTSPYSSPNNR